jgi:hypothetical protein
MVPPLELTACFGRRLCRAKRLFRIETLVSRVKQKSTFDENNGAASTPVGCSGGNTRSSFINAARDKFDFPQGLKPNGYGGPNGMAEAMPLQGGFVKPARKARLKRLPKKSEEQIPRGLKPPRDDKNKRG